MRVLLARLISILGHPFLLLSAAGIGLAILNGAPKELLTSLAVTFLAVGIVAMAYSIWSVRSGKWMHIDAINPAERGSLNWFLAAILMAGSAIAWRNFPVRELAIGFFVSGLAVVVALASSRLCEMSLHTCFASLAAGLFWPNKLILGCCLAIVVAVAWSRLALRRHTPFEVVFGVLVGIASAMAYHALVAIFGRAAG